MRESSESPVPEAAGDLPAPGVLPRPIRTTACRRGLEPAQGGVAVEMPTSTGQRRKMRRVGTLTFMLKGQPLSLGAFVEADEKDMRRLFVPFGDLTNGIETYHGGRYLDLERTRDGPLRSRLQSRVSPVLPLQLVVRLPVSAAREPAEGADPRRASD